MGVVMATRSEPNAQNSEINPEAHPSGARIERMMNRANREMSAGKPGVDVSEREANEISNDTNRSDVAENLGPDQGRDHQRPSERYTSTDDPAEGARDQVSDGHRQSPEDR